ncbi:putative glycylpeptide n-tetradecanoyltransferase [Diaporthe ampelina]|uniref:Glycylpeptide N-tetradecanoyltransferase n=1 Tax=Diaporthe ampelina TaxID=1214573 RepID=A0A0G2FM25_9PEZI|nr:putative glycylpeptide n-tetradecanoyltransferase [Diaporthe ampelina]
MAAYKSWSTQTVTRFDEEVNRAEDGPMQNLKLEDIPTEPALLAVAGLECVTLDVGSDDDSRKPVALISAVPVQLRVRKNTLNAAEVNLICVQKKLRSKRLAPVLIKDDHAPDGKGVVTDSICFLSLESPIIGNPKHKVLRVAYLFYCASEIGLATPLDRPAYKASLHQLVGDALVVVKLAKFDVFNALSLMEDGLFLEEQKLGPGNGMSHYYYPFNSRASPIL